MIGFSCNFLHDAFLLGVRQNIPKLIIYIIFGVRPCINFINKGMSIFQKLFAM